jgi:hypothetical protein
VRGSKTAPLKAAIIATVRGDVDGKPTTAENFMRRLRELVEIEARALGRPVPPDPYRPTGDGDGREPSTAAARVAAAAARTATFDYADAERLAGALRACLPVVSTAAAGPTGPAQSDAAAHLARAKYALAQHRHLRAALIPLGSPVHVEAAPGTVVGYRLDILRMDSADLNPLGKPRHWYFVEYGTSGVQQLVEPAFVAEAP